MKRLIFCFDGTWNALERGRVTNVGMVAQSIAPTDPDGVVQVVYYDEGVGNARYGASLIRRKVERVFGGAFGRGLLANLVEAYEFAIFNYEPGDEIYVFGFSRGAFSARSFVGLLRANGILRRSHVEHVHEAVDNYRDLDPAKREDEEKLREFRWQRARDTLVDEDEDLWRRERKKGEYDPDASHFLNVEFLGVWDTVGSLGLPNQIPLVSKLFNRRYQFHDCKLTEFVRSARHAVAVDERRKNFAPTLWENVDDLNRRCHEEDGSVPYDQQWFLGTHGSVGGGGGVRGLSDGALAWVLEGARNRGLAIDLAEGSEIFVLKPDPMAPLDNADPTKKPNFFSVVLGLLPGADRLPGPASLDEVSQTTKQRWAADPSYRPASLGRVRTDLDEFAARQPGQATIDTERRTHVVTRGDTLFGLSNTYYGDGSLYPALFAVNKPLLTHPDQIFVGQELIIPPEATVRTVASRLVKPAAPNASATAAE